ncbi:hypothetical protein H0H81_010338 [Sphagnurus paluster]|uniref:FAD/NAD(P)-binding domain-containing protein n=1 Tax=Sphagnurus paluster TaxID=117069 RepID=A0A9P7K3S7_9AGAR|nr:hypothetical protein H0H81_010338 [Sphagnurus paluster]
MSNRQNVVVVGAGGAGTATARSLSSTLDPGKYNLILITARPYYLHLIGSIRAAVTAEDNFAEQVAIPLDKLFVNGNGKIIIGKVTGISENSKNGGYVKLANGMEVPYSILVLAPGSYWQGPLSVPNTKQEHDQWFRQWQSKFENAQDILLIGGGAVGIEFAGEIKDLNPSKRVTIVHGGQYLLNGAYPVRYRKDIERRLRLRGVELILGDVVPDRIEIGNVTTRNGKRLTPDLIVSCRGPRPNTAFIESSLGPEVLASNGFVTVLPTFQIPGHARIFAAGDVADLKEQKQLGKYPEHANIISANILAILSGQQPTQTYKGAKEIIIITIGKNGGASYFGILWGLVFGDWFSSKLKSRTLRIGHIRTELGHES